MTCRKILLNYCTGIFFFLFLPIRTFGEPPAGARISGMAGSSATLTDLWSITGNPAGLSGQTHLSAGAGGEMPYSLPGLFRWNTAGVLPLPRGSVGVLTSHLGGGVFRELSFFLACGFRMSRILHLGAGLGWTGSYRNGWHQVSDTPSWRIGGIIHWSEKWKIGSCLSGETISGKGNKTDSAPKTQLRMGISFSPVKETSLCIEMGKETENKTELSLGLECEPIHFLILRAGIGTGALQWAIGMACRIQKISANLSLTHHKQLGYTPGISLEMRIPSKYSQHRFGR